jgi:lipoate-protein ligase B
MKLRIKGNSLRLRVTRPELATLEQGSQVAEIIHFGPEAGQSLRYVLGTQVQSAPIAVSFAENAITVTLAQAQLEEWSKEDQVGVYTKLDIGHASPLEVAVEKDFKCLDSRGEEDEDAFPNPSAGKAC